MTHPPWHVMAEPRHAGDALQRPLRFRFPPRLRPGQWESMVLLLQPGLPTDVAYRQLIRPVDIVHVSTK
jgi:hypothetical protein